MSVLRNTLQGKFHFSVTQTRLHACAAECHTRSVHEKTPQKHGMHVRPPAALPAEDPPGALGTPGEGDSCALSAAASRCCLASARLAVSAKAASTPAPARRAESS